MSSPPVRVQFPQFSAVACSNYDSKLVVTTWAVKQGKAATLAKAEMAMKLQQALWLLQQWLTSHSVKHYPRDASLMQLSVRLTASHVDWIYVLTDVIKIRQPTDWPSPRPAVHLGTPRSFRAGDGFAKCSPLSDVYTCAEQEAFN